jgi:hypothetical protein
VAKLVNPASRAKIVTASKIEVSFRRVEIETDSTRVPSARWSRDSRDTR